MASIIKCPGLNDLLFRKIELANFDTSTCIIVPDTHNAIIVCNGIANETLPSGKHFIFTKNKNGDFGYAFSKEDNIEVIFISKTAKLNVYWGTTTQWEMRDVNTGVSIKLGASGEFEVQICNPRKAYLELIGQNPEFNVDDLKKRLQGRLLAEVQYSLATTMEEMKLSYDRLGEVLLPISKAIFPCVKDMFESDYGLRIYSFTISQIIINDEDIKKIGAARAAKAVEKMRKFELEHKEKMDDKEYEREVARRNLELEDYKNYLEVVGKVGWPSSKSKQTDAKECPNCNAPLKTESKFCPVCGFELQKTKIKCPNCNKLISKSDTFCKHCGAKVGG